MAWPSKGNLPFPPPASNEDVDSVWEAFAMKGTFHFSGGRSVLASSEDRLFVCRKTDARGRAYLNGFPQKLCLQALNSGP
jgi:hypothetical protein